MNTNNTLQMDALDILFANKNKMYGAYQLRRNYNKRLSVAVTITLAVCLCFAIAYGIGKKEHVSAPILSMTDVNLISAPPKDKIAIEPPLTWQKIEEPVATIKVTPPKIVPDNLVTTPPPTQDDISDTKIDVKTTEGRKEDFVAPPVEVGTGKVEELIKPEDYTKEFFTVQQQAEFPGGLEEWRKFLLRNLRSELPSENGAAAGSYTVMVSFLVNTDGSVSEVRAESDLGYGTAAEAVRVIQHSQTWMPAKQNNHQVIYRQRQAITFVVSGE